MTRFFEIVDGILVWRRRQNTVLLFFLDWILWGVCGLIANLFIFASDEVMLRGNNMVEVAGICGTWLGLVPAVGFAVRRMGTKKYEDRKNSSDDYFPPAA